MTAKPQPPKQLSLLPKAPPTAEQLAAKDRTRAAMAKFAFEAATNRPLVEKLQADLAALDELLASADPDNVFSTGSLRARREEQAARLDALTRGES